MSTFTKARWKTLAKRLDAATIWPQLQEVLSTAGLRPLVQSKPGRSRTVYEIEVQGLPPVVLKVEHRRERDEQTTAEVFCSRVAKSPLVPQVFAFGGPPGRGPTWMLVERLRPVDRTSFRNLTGVSFKVFDDALIYADLTTKFRAMVMRKSDAPERTAAFLDAFLELVETCKLNPGELGILANWGVGDDGQLKASDLGDLEDEGHALARSQLLAWSA